MFPLPKDLDVIVNDKREKVKLYSKKKITITK